MPSILPILIRLVRLPAALLLCCAGCVAALLGFRDLDAWCETQLQHIVQPLTEDVSTCLAELFGFLAAALCWYLLWILL